MEQLDPAGRRRNSLLLKDFQPGTGKEFVFPMQALLGFLFPVENEEARKGLRKGNADFGKRSFLIKATFGKWPFLCP
jgi:hypothetical protein